MSESRLTPEGVRWLADAGLTATAMALYTPPFRFIRGYIYDARHHMVADDESQDVALRVRGWGRVNSDHQKGVRLEDPEALQDRVGELIAAALTDFWTKAQR